MIRLFIAAELPAEIRGFLHQAATACVSKCFPKDKIRTIPPDALHLTLRFFGETPESKIPDIEAAIESATEDFGDVEVATGQIRVFTPFVLAIGIQDRTGRLKGLQEALKSKIEASGFPTEARHFRPHVTIGRTRGSRRLPQNVAIEEISEIPFRISGVSLIQSILLPEGATYNSLKHFSLR